MGTDSDFGTEEDGDTSPKKQRNKKFFIAVGMLIFASWGSMFLFWWGLDEDKSGVLGDTFGMINALFSGFAFLGVIYAIFQQSEELGLQRVEIKLQRRELELSRKELSGQKGEMKAQREAIEHQNFETTFFNMLQQYRKMAVNQGGNSLIYFYDIFNDLSNFLSPENNQLNSEEILSEIYSLLTNNNVFQNFDFLLLLFKKIENQPKSVRSDYVEIIKRTLYPNELRTLFWYGYFRKNFVGYCTTYKIFDSIQLNSIFIFLNEYLLEDLDNPYNPEDFLQ